MNLQRFLSLFLLFGLLLGGCRPAALPLPASPAAAEQATARPPLPTPSPTLPPPEAAAAPMFRGGLNRSGVFALEGAAVEWIFETDNSINSSPVVYGDTVYIASFDGGLYALDLATGKQQWVFHSDAAGLAQDAPSTGAAQPNSFFSTPAVTAEAVFVGDMSGTFYRVERETGEKDWAYSTQGAIISSPAVANGRVYFGSEDGAFYSLEADTGEAKWIFPTQKSIISSPAVTEEAVYFGSQDGFLYALNPLSGEKLWMRLVEGNVQSSPSVVDGVVYVPSVGEVSHLYAFEAQTGEPISKFKINAPAISSPAVVEGSAYFGDVNGKVYAIDLKNGAERWSFQTGDQIITSPAVTGEAVYAASLDGRLYAINRETGTELWRFQTENEIWGSPAVVGDTILIGSGDRRLYALDRRGRQLALALHPTAPPPAPTPTFVPETTEAVETNAEGLPWWNDRVFYEVFVRSYKDSDGDGIGDLQGLIQNLDYLNDGDPSTRTDLGVTGLWLMPVTESPSYHGYDVVDYRTVEQDYGTNEDLQALIAAAHERDMVVIIDLVMNHISWEHPWFQSALEPGSPYENYFIWSDEKPNYFSPWGSNVWHKADLRYYYGLFWEGMPDLNYRNGAVTEEMFEIIRFWLEDMEVDGFRLDAVRHLVEEGPVQENTEASHAWLKGFHRFVRSVAPQAVTVGEAWTSTEEVVKFIGDEVDLAFEFDLAQAMLESVDRGSGRMLREAMAEVLASFPEGQYATFLSNHDQTRVMTNLGKDLAKAKLAAGLLLTQPGVPFIYYGEEIGMQGLKEAGDPDLRTPLHWEAGPTAGFTTGTPWIELAPEVETANIAVQNGDPDSLLNHYRALVSLRQAHPALLTGDTLLVEAGEAEAVYSFLRYTADETLLVVANLSDEAVSDYRLALASGPLQPGLQAEILFGEGAGPAAPAVSARGGFEGYQPMAELPPHSLFVIRLGR